MSDKLRKGMWVVDSSGKAGILVSFLDFGNTEVHYVAETGETYAVVQVPSAELKQAKFVNIPVSRRPNLEIARAKGY